MPILTASAAGSLGLRSRATRTAEAHASSTLALSCPSPSATAGGRRHQRGTVVTLGVAPGRTDQVPVAAIVGPGDSPLGSYPMPLVQGGSAPSYRTRLRLPGGIALGIYRVTISYSVAGVPGTAVDQFEVIPGGDSGGEVIGLYCYDGPDARYVLAQLGAGKLVQGRNPYLK